MSAVGLGLGLLSLGRAWGYRSEPPPTEADGQHLLDTAFELGVRCYDTAPAYGSSEQRFGAFLSRLGAERSSVFVATKLGEHWDAGKQASFTDHSYDALRRSLDESVRLLGRIDLLQVHKATAANVSAPEVLRVLEYAGTLGVRHVGVSVSDVAAAEAACDVGVYSFLQFPFNALNTTLAPAFELAARHGLQVLVNRPFAMGQLVQEEGREPTRSARESLQHILRQRFSGYVLTGTKSAKHLLETHAVFRSLQG
ncbi:aldo/keto reductase [Myxococcus faecalis]|uniref:aldo/keto reductase n=1 Tax=Myxococcus faecalis TaxID=3115646 RepID=UPI0038D24122